MFNFFVANGICDFCASDYISENSEKRLKGLPNSHQKEQETERIIKEAQASSYKLCVQYPCTEDNPDIYISHKICFKHILEMCEVIKEYQVKDE